MVRDLASFRVDGEAPAAPPTPESATGGRAKRYGSILAVDQALAKIGWAFISCDGVDRRVLATGMCRAEATDYKGYEDSLRRGTFLAQQLRPVVRGEAWAKLWGIPDVVVHEMPPIMGPASRRADSSLLAAMTVRVVCDEHWMACAMLNRQHVYKQLGLGRQATKREVADYVRSVVPDLVVRKPGPLNEDTYDAIALGLVAAEGNWLSPTREGAM